VQHYCRRRVHCADANVTVEETKGEGRGLFVKTLRDIKQNEAIWLSYGPLYWLEALSIDDRAPLIARLAILAYMIAHIQKSSEPCSSPALMWLPDPPISACLSPRRSGHDIKHSQTISFERPCKKLTQDIADQLSNRWLELFGLPAKGYAAWAAALHSVKVTEFLFTATVACEENSRCPHCEQSGAVHEESHVAAYTYQKRAGPELLCAVCTKNNAKYCTSCRSVAYCSKACQRQAWPGHKGACKAHSEFRAALTRAAPLQ
jgi:hypothetical protein